MLNFANHKKCVASTNEAIKNLEQLKKMLNTDKQKQLDVYINQMKELRSRIADDIYGRSRERSRYAAERLKRDIMFYFAYPKIKNNLV